MNLRIQLEGNVVVYRTRSVTITWSVQLSTDNILRYNMSIEKKRYDFNSSPISHRLVTSIASPLYFTLPCSGIPILPYICGELPPRSPRKISRQPIRWPSIISLTSGKSPTAPVLSTDGPISVVPFGYFQWLMSSHRLSLYVSAQGIRRTSPSPGDIRTTWRRFMIPPAFPPPQASVTSIPLLSCRGQW